MLNWTFNSQSRFGPIGVLAFLTMEFTTIQQREERYDIATTLVAARTENQIEQTCNEIEERRGIDFWQFILPHQLRTT